MASKNEQPAVGGPLTSRFVFKSSDLYKRRGFERGDILADTFPHVGAAELRNLLVDVLRAHVIPRLDQKVQVLVLSTVHNPLRAVYVDGIAVRWTAESGQGPTLTPASVDVSVDDVLACARKRKIATPV